MYKSASSSPVKAGKKFINRSQSNSGTRVHNNVNSSPVNAGNCTNRSPVYTGNVDKADTITKEVFVRSTSAGLSLIVPITVCGIKTQAVVDVIV